MLNVISFVLNVEMSTGFVLVTVKTSYAHTYLHALQNVFPMNYDALLSWVLEVLYIYMNFKMQDKLSGSSI